MDSPMMAVDRIKAILFDMNGTLRMRVHDEKWQKQSVEHLLALLGMPDAPASFLEELNRRYKTYTEWADENETSLSEAEIWTKWITPELPRERIVPQAVELMLAFRNHNGRHILKPGATAVISELHRRGYRLGVISNTTSTADLPRFIDVCGLQKYFEVVILSSVFGVRKPSPTIYREATRLMRLDPAQYAYIGNKIANDIAGAHKAGYGMAILVAPGSSPLAAEQARSDKPDLIIHELVNLLDIFQQGSQK
jgi:putative hydrolase of the HAD superfamily